MRKLFLLLFLVSSFAFGQRSRSYILAGQGCSDTAGDLFPTGNAASECSDEADTTTDWAAVGSGGVANVAETSGGSNYVIEITSADASASQGASITATGLNASLNYNVSIRYRVTVDVSSTQSIRSWSGVTTSPDFTMNDDGAWHTEVFNVDPTSTAITIRAYSTQAAAAGANKIQIDYITVVPE